VSVQLSITALAAALCAISLSTILAPAGSAASAKDMSLPAGCGPRPSWIEGDTLPRESQDSLVSCFSSDPPEAEARLKITSSRPYAQLITVSGAALDLDESSFASPREATFSRLLANSSASGAPAAFLLGPRAGVALLLDRPAPGEAEQVNVDPAPGNAFAVGAVVWTFVNDAAKGHLLPADTDGCIATAVDGALSRPPRPEHSFRRIHSCVNASGLSTAAEGRLRDLAGRVLRGNSFKEVFSQEGTQARLVRISYTVAASNPYLSNPAIHLGRVDFGSLPAGERTVKHLTATGGAPPYRFYLLPEAGGPSVPSWLRLAADGTLVIEAPPAGATIDVPVEVVDSNGEHSVVAY